MRKINDGRGAALLRQSDYAEKEKEMAHLSNYVNKVVTSLSKD